MLERGRAERRPRFLDDLFPAQHTFVADPARRKAALCTRRAGKTFGAAFYLASSALERAGVTCVYIALSRGHAKRLLWPDLHRVSDKHGLGLTFNETELRATAPNGSQIWLVGADDARTVERLRGGKYRLVIIDEAGSFQQELLDYLMLEILEPALIDELGTMCLLGTPVPIAAGLFYEVTTGQRRGWACHGWSILDNPHVPHAAEEVERIRLLNNWAPDHPKYQREYLGRWVRDTESLVYRYEQDRNWADALPTDGEWKYVLGVDFGVRDATAFAVLAWRRSVPRQVWLVEAWGRSGMISQDAADEIDKLRARYPFALIVGDEGGMGKLFGEELRRRFRVPIIPAQKTSKRGFIELLNSDLIAGNLRVVGPSCTEWISEAIVCQWNEDRTGEDPQFSNHRLDAALYGWRECYAWAEKAPPAAGAEPGTPEWYEAEQKRMREAAIARARKGALERSRRILRSA